MDVERPSLNPKALTLTDAVQILGKAGRVTEAMLKPIWPSAP